MDLVEEDGDKEGEEVEAVVGQGVERDSQWIRAVRRFLLLVTRPLQL